jgi:hypothetical protein
MAERCHRVARLKALKLAAALQEAKRDTAELKQEVYVCNDLLLAERKVAARQAELQQLERNERNLESACCFGAPDWSGAGDAWGPEQEVTEVVYTASMDEERGAQAVKFEHGRTATRLQLYTQPFAHGGLRMAFYARDSAGRKLVAKKFLQPSAKFRRNVANAHLDAEASALSVLAANDFSAALEKSASDQAARVSYLSASVALPETKREIGGGEHVYILEPWLDSSVGKWEKFTMNDGTITSPDEIMQAFSHFSMRYTCGASGGVPLAVFDTQGVKEPGIYMLTDPAISSVTKLYGKTDFGAEAQATFLKMHTCSSVCAHVRCSAAAPPLGP